MIQDREPTAPPSPDAANHGEPWFRAGEEAFQEGSYVRAASSYLAAAAAGHRFPESLYRAAGALAKAGAHEDAMKTLEVAIEAGFDATEVGSDPSFEGLRADPRFLALVNAQPRPQVPVMPVVVPPTYEVAGSSPHKHALNQSGIELMRAGQYDRAIAAFEEEVRQVEARTRCTTSLAPTRYAGTSAVRSTPCNVPSRMASTTAST